jgi:hypothetical protein
MSNIKNIRDYTVLNEKAIVVKVRKEPWKDCFIDSNSISFMYNWGGFVRGSDDYMDADFDVVKLPPGQWSKLGMSDKLTEDEWKKVVDWYTDSNDSSYDPQYNETTYFDVYKDYTTGDEGELETATESGFSLLKSKGIEVPHLILIKT